MSAIRNPLKLIYPDQCLLCGSLVEGEFGLCGACWARTPFLGDPACDACGLPVMALPGDGPSLCERCHARHPPWDRGRAVLAYRDEARRLVLAFKHGERIDLARPAGRWMATRGRDLLSPGTLVLPVPIHWTRLLRRRFNQSALLAREVARVSGAVFLPDALVRARRTPSQEGKDRAQRAANLKGAIRPHPRRGRMLLGREVVIVDDVLTTGATLKATVRAARRAGAERVDVLVLARTGREDPLL